MTLPDGRPSQRRSCPSRRPYLAASPLDGVCAPKCGDLLCFHFSPTRAPFSLHLPACLLSHRHAAPRHGAPASTPLLPHRRTAPRHGAPHRHAAARHGAPRPSLPTSSQSWCPPGCFTSYGRAPPTGAAPRAAAAPPPMLELVNGNKKEDDMWVFYVIDC
jgi:hypothetical protein